MLKLAWLIRELFIWRAFNLCRHFRHFQTRAARLWLRAKEGLAVRVQRERHREEEASGHAWLGCVRSQTQPEVPPGRTGPSGGVLVPAGV